MNFKICIPSYKRPYWKALKWLISEGVPKMKIHLFLHSNSEYWKYYTAQNLKGLNCHITNVPEGLGYQRSYIMEKMYPSKILLIDDDVTEIYKFNQSIKGGREKVPLISTIEEFFNKSEKFKCKMFGVSLINNPFWARKNKDFVFGKFFGGYLIGIDGWRCNLMSQMSSDLEMALCSYRDKIRIIRFDKYTVDAEHLTPGGSAWGHHLRGEKTLMPMAKRYLSSVGIEGYKELGLRCLVQTLERKWVAYCPHCKSGFVKKDTYKTHLKFPCKELKNGL